MCCCNLVVCTIWILLSPTCISLQTWTFFSFYGTCISVGVQFVFSLVLPVNWWNGLRYCGLESINRLLVNPPKMLCACDAKLLCCLYLVTEEMKRKENLMARLHFRHLLDPYNHGLLALNCLEINNSYQIYLVNSLNWNQFTKTYWAVQIIMIRLFILLKLTPLHYSNTRNST